MPQTFPCPDSDELERIVHGQAQAWDVERIARHLETCGMCADAVDLLLDGERVVAALRVDAVESLRGEDSIVQGLISRLQGWQHQGSADTSPQRERRDCDGTSPERERRDCDGTSPERERRDSLGAATTSASTGHTESAEDILRLLASPAEPDELGRFGPYGILRVLGSGGMGVVFAARQTHPRRVVALKVILAGPGASGRRLARFHAETELIARLHHANVVQVYETGEYQGLPYFTMEHLEGGSLAQRLAVSPLAARPAAELVETLARAVQFAHEHGIVHRDLKPGNVVLTSPHPPAPSPKAGEGEKEAALPLSPWWERRPGGEGGAVPKITDFGLAKQFEDETAPAGVYRTESGAIVGTPAYMAPEQALGHSEVVGPAADVYALGAILYECLTSRPPFRAATLLETLEQVRSEEPIPPSRLQPGLPRDLQTICLKCLEKLPHSRYASAEELADDLGRFLRGEPIHARPVSSLERLRKWVRRKPALAALAAVSILSLVALVTGGLIYQARLRAAVERADTKAAEAERQKERVEAGYQAAHDTLDRMLGRLESRRVSEVPQLKELQRALLEDSLAFYLGQIAGADDPDPAVRRDTALACKRAADIQLVMGREEAAAGNYRRALALLEDLPPESRDAPENLVLQAACFNNLGTLAGRADRRDEEEQYHQRALVIRERLAQSRPDDPASQKGLAESLHNLGHTYTGIGRMADAEALYKRAVAIRVALLSSNPRDEVCQGALSEDYVNLGRLYQSTNRPDEASKAFEKADALLRPLADREPPAGRYTLSLIALYCNWGYLLAGENRSREALGRLDEAVRRADTAYRQEPQHYYTRQRAVQAHGARAEVHEHFGNLADSVKDWDRVVELEDEPARYDRRLVRARVLTRTGEHVRATAEADELAKQPEAKGDNLIYLAQIYGLAIAPARGDAKLEPSEREARAERYGSSGVAMLRKLQEEGYFKDVGHLQLLRSDKRVRMLREQEDFQRLLKQVEGTKK